MAQLVGVHSLFNGTVWSNRVAASSNMPNRTTTTTTNNDLVPFITSGGCHVSSCLHNFQAIVTIRFLVNWQAADSFKIYQETDHYSHQLGNLLCGTAWGNQQLSSKFSRDEKMTPIDISLITNLHHFSAFKTSTVPINNIPRIYRELTPFTYCFPHSGFVDIFYNLVPRCLLQHI